MILERYFVFFNTNDRKQGLVISVDNVDSQLQTLQL